MKQIEVLCYLCIVEKVKDFSPSNVADINEGHSEDNVLIWKVVPIKIFFIDHTEYK